MTAVPPRPAARDRYWLCGDDCTTDCGACKGSGRPAAPEPMDELNALTQEQITSAAPDATAGDGLRSDEWWTRLFLAVEELVSSVPYTDGSKWPVPHAAAFRAAVEPALRDVLAAAARDAEAREAVTSLAVQFETLGEALHSVPAAEAYADAAASLREALDDPS